MSSSETNGQRSIPKQPKGLLVLFFAELWERFSFYGMRSLLTLYMTKVQRYTDSAAYGVYAAYGLLVYAFPVLGGLLADRLLGFRVAILLGGLLMAAGHFVMAIPGETTLYVALALLCLGNGFFKPNISTLLGKLYAPDDTRRDAGFFTFYLGINIGAFAAPLLCGTIGQRINWHWGFGLAGVGMLIGLGWFVLGKQRLGDQGAPPDPDRLYGRSAFGVSRLGWIVIGSLLAVGPTAFAIWRNDLVPFVLYPLGIAVYGAIAFKALKLDTVSRGRLFAAMVLMAGSMVFWALFEQAGSSLTLFTDRNVDRAVVPGFAGLRERFGSLIPASAFLAANPLYIMVLALPFGRLWAKLQQCDRDPSIPAKFALGLMQVGLGYLVIARLAVPNAAAEGLTHVGWLLLMYLLHTTGELCLSPVGLSAMTKLAPQKMAGTVMGAWFLASAYSYHFGGLIAKLTAIPQGARAVSAGDALATYADVFLKIGWSSIGVGIVFVLFAATIKRMMHGVR